MRLQLNDQLLFVQLSTVGTWKTVFDDNTTEVARGVARCIEMCGDWKARRVNSYAVFVVVEPHSEAIGSLADINGFRALSTI